MSSETVADSQLTQYVVAHRRRLAQLPDGEFVKADLPPACKEEFARLQSVGVITSTGWEDGRNRQTWIVQPHVRQLLADLDNRESQAGPVTPCCGYRGWVNLRDGEFECKLCGREFDEFAEGSA